jgi:hypothetical protein
MAGTSNPPPPSVPNAPSAKLIEASEPKNAGSMSSHVHALDGDRVNGWGVKCATLSSESFG